MSQTTVQNANSIRFGSALVEIGDSIENLVNIGAATGIVFNHSFDKTTINSDNAGTILEKISNEKATVTGNFMETSLENLSRYIKGISTVEETQSTQKSVTDEVHVFAKINQGVRLNNRNANGAIVSSIVLKKNGSAKTLGTDYGTFVDADGWTYVYPISGGTLNAGDSITVSYSYTPAASKKMKVGGIKKIEANIVRITNYNSEGKKFEITVFKAAANSGINMTFNSDDSDEVNVVPFELIGTCDTSRELGDQLFEIVDEQSA